MFKTNDILSFLRARVNDLDTSAYHETFFAVHHLFILGQVPLGWLGKTSVRLLYAAHLGNFLVKYFYFFLNFFQRIIVGTFAVSLKKFDIFFRKRNALVVLKFLVGGFFGLLVVWLHRLLLCVDLFFLWH